MDRLPEEVVLHVLSYLDILNIVALQAVSRRYLALARDNTLWKTECFNHSRAESLRRRQQLLKAQDSRLSELRDAFSAWHLSAPDVALLQGSPQSRASSDPAAEARNLRHRAMVNWEPGYGNDKFDYYEEFIHRHAPINVGWLTLPKCNVSDKETQPEATGIAAFSGSQGERPDRIVAPLDDGSVCIFDISSRSTSSSGGHGRLLVQSKRGLLTGRSEDAGLLTRAAMTETGAVESVAIDGRAQKGYFAVQNQLHELDLVTMQLISTKQYPFPITALSEASDNAPLTVGTNWTVHLHDPRDPAFASGETSSGGELIGGSVYSHANLSQPGPLSILHQGSAEAADSSIWVAGRFTSLLNYDRRFFPRLCGTIHSGARIASLAFIPSPLIPRSLDLARNPETSIAALLEARGQPGKTMLAAAEYKGKGSLEFYGLPTGVTYQNRQTASATKLLSAVPHGGRVVFSDGDGNVKWLERDGFSLVRTFNINDNPTNQAEQDASAYGIWSSTASEMPGQGDIVQKLLTLSSPSANDGSGSISGLDDRTDINQSTLLLWTGDGRLGMLGFGHDNPLGGDDEWHDSLEAQAQTVEQRAHEDAERQFGMAMRRALERNADEVRFVRGLGLMQ